MAFVTRTYNDGLLGNTRKRNLLVFNCYCFTRPARIPSINSSRLPNWMWIKLVGFPRRILTLCDDAIELFISFLEELIFRWSIVGES